MNQSEFLAITGNLLKAREKSRVKGAIGYGFASKKLARDFKPINKRSNRRFHQNVSDEAISGIGRKWTRSNSCDSDSY